MHAGVDKSKLESNKGCVAFQKLLARTVRKRRCIIEVKNPIQITWKGRSGETPGRPQPLLGYDFHYFPRGRYIFRKQCDVVQSIVKIVGKRIRRQFLRFLEVIQKPQYYKYEYPIWTPGIPVCGVPNTFWQQSSGKGCIAFNVIVVYEIQVSAAI